jgi:restriction system protein
MNNHSALSAHTSFIHRCEEIVKEHASELTIRRNQLSRASIDGAIDSAKWCQEVESFIDQIMVPQTGDIRDPAGRLNAVRGLIDAATVHYLSSRVCFSPDGSSIPYEQLVANSLTDLGWETEPFRVPNDDRTELIAEMRHKRVLIHCRRFADSTGLLAIDNVCAHQLLASADFVVLVGNSKFTKRAKQLAASRSVLVLHHNQLTQLEERIFGTDTWRDIAPRTVQSDMPDLWMVKQVADAA